MNWISGGARRQAGRAGGLAGANGQAEGGRASGVEATRGPGRSGREGVRVRASEDSIRRARGKLRAGDATMWQQIIGCACSQSGGRVHWQARIGKRALARVRARAELGQE